MRATLGAAALAAALFGFVVVAAPVAVAQDGHEGAGAEQAGAEHGAPQLDVLKLVAGFVNFFLLVGVLVYLARKPTRAFLVSRRAVVVEGLAEAEKMKAAADAKYQEYQARLANLDAELAQLRAEIVAAGEADRQTIIAEAERKAARLRRETEFLIEQQLKQLRVDLTKETVEAAMHVAEQVLRERATADDQQRLAKAYLTRLGPPARTSSGSEGGAA